MSTSTTRMHYTFRNSLAIKMRYLLQKLIILQRGRATITNGTKALIVTYWMPLPGCKYILLYGIRITGTICGTGRLFLPILVVLGVFFFIHSDRLLSIPNIKPEAMPYPSDGHINFYGC